MNACCAFWKSSVWSAAMRFQQAVNGAVPAVRPWKSFAHWKPAWPTNCCTTPILLAIWYEPYETPPGSPAPVETTPGPRPPVSYLAESAPSASASAWPKAPTALGNGCVFSVELAGTGFGGTGLVGNGRVASVAPEPFGRFKTSPTLILLGSVIWGFACSN